MRDIIKRKEKREKRKKDQRNRATKKKKKRGGEELKRKVKMMIPINELTGSRDIYLPEELRLLS